MLFVQTGVKVLYYKLLDRKFSPQTVFYIILNLINFPKSDSSSSLQNYKRFSPPHRQSRLLRISQ